MDYILYTYQEVEGQEKCHAYGPAAQESCEQAGETLKARAVTAAEPALGFMVLPLETWPL